MNKASSPMHTERWRVWVFYALMIAAFGFYALRLLDYQIVRGEDFKTAALDQRKRDISIPTQRGIIYDRNGYILARNVPSYNLVITPALLPEDEGEVQEIYRKLSELSGIPVNNGELTEARIKVFKPCNNDLGIAQIVYIANTNWPFSPVQIQCNIDESIAMMVNEKSADWPGVGIEILPVRDYPSGSITSEVVGFLGPIPALLKDQFEALGFDLNRDKIGYAGIESTMDEYLLGRNGSREVEVDVAGKVVRDLKVPVEAIPGNNVTLTIDTRLQRAARDALISQMADVNRQFPQYALSNGVVIAMNPKTGEVLALVSYPNFENNLMERQIPAYYYEQLQRDPNRPLFNHAISAEHPPGSVFKLAAAIGILNEDVVTVDQLIDDPGKITIQERFLENETGRSRDYVCYLYKTTGGGHGKLDFLSGLAESCDVYFYKVGGGYQDEVPKGLGIWRLGEYARALGYGEITGIELPGEASGLIPDPNWKRLTIAENWSTGDTYIATIGQGYVLATPIQVLVSAATVANDGKMMKPTLIKQIADADGNVVKSFEPILVRDITKDAVITVYDENSFATDQKIPVQAWVVAKVKEGMRKVVVDGTARTFFEGMTVQSAGKTGTAEYCDNVAQAKGACGFGKWLSHAWYVGYAPYNDPEIVVVAFVYNGNEGSRVAAPIVRKVMEAYFCLQSPDPVTCP
ncbi:MAG TPA: penicillin-binding protein 2 [Anaerolineaceae bacterium]|nr:penicillin-binding protein 2 [Anaerolineaceae bacterium]